MGAVIYDGTRKPWSVGESGRAFYRVCSRGHPSRGLRGGAGVSLAAEFQEFYARLCANAYPGWRVLGVYEEGVIKIVSKRLVQLMVQVNCMK